MSDNTPTLIKNIKLSNKEKIAGGVLTVGLAGLGIYGIFLAMPILLTVTWGIAQIVAVLAAVGALLFVVTDKQTRTLFGRLYRLLIRKMWYAVMKYDPIAQLEEHILLMRKKFQEMGEQRKVLHGQAVGLRRQIEKNEQERIAALRLVRAAKGTPDAESVLAGEGARAGRRELTNRKLSVLLEKVETCDRVLTKMHKNLGFLIEDTKDQVDLVRSEFIATKAAGAAAENAMEIINGDPETKKMFEDTMSHIESEVADRLGRFEMMMMDSDSFVKSIDLTNSMYKQSALDALEAWEKKSDQLLLDPGKKRVDVSVDPAVGAEPLAASPDEQDEVADLFAKKN